MPNTTTKVCPSCNSTFLILLRSQHKKICTDCRRVIPWHLDPGQPPLFGRKVETA